MYRVFVYGTLKKGYGNAKYLLSDQEYEGPNVTKDRYVMGNVGFPYCFPKEAFDSKGIEVPDDLFKQVSGDVWSVTDEALVRLDRLEGEGWHYHRKLVELKDETKAFMYQNLDGTAIFNCLKCDTTEQGEWKWNAN